MVCTIIIVIILVSFLASYLGLKVSIIYLYDRSRKHSYKSFARNLKISKTDALKLYIMLLI